MQHTSALFIQTPNAVIAYLEHTSQAVDSLYECFTDWLKASK